MDEPGVRISTLFRRDGTPFASPTRGTPGGHRGNTIDGRYGYTNPPCLGWLISLPCVFACERNHKIGWAAIANTAVSHQSAEAHEPE